jgi:hypothetical protein
MADEIDKVVEQKVKERLEYIEAEKRNDDAYLRFFLALLGAGASWWLASKFGAKGKDLFGAIGIGVFFGVMYELFLFAILIINIIVLIKLIDCATPFL